jgi:hypothetical protein
VKNLKISCDSLLKGNHGREPDIRVEGNFTKNRYWFILNTGQKIAQVHPKEELRGPKVFPTVKGIVTRDKYFFEGL